jgi:predicted tellurium resistance membrane protein TerC
MFEWIAQPEAWLAFGTLVALEVVLGIDNIIFISILVGRLPADRRGKARSLGILFAMLTRLGLLFSLTWVMGLVDPLFTLFDEAISGRDIILILGGLFLLGKSTHEIHGSLELEGEEASAGRQAGFVSIIVQIAILDIVFSLDSVITAVGLVQNLEIMVLAIIISVGVMLAASKSISDFIDRNPTIKMLALSFLILIGCVLVAEGFDVHVPKGYIYFAMAFSVAVEMLNIRLRERRHAKAISLTKAIRE